MNNKYRCTLLAFLCLTLCANYGCAFHPKSMLKNFLGIGCSDLIAAKDTGKVKEVDLPKDKIIEKIDDIIISNQLSILRQNRARDIIVIVGLPNQVDTTQVAIFVDKKTDNTCNITLSSLSSSALDTAENIIFSQL